MPSPKRCYVKLRVFFTKKIKEMYPKKRGAMNIITLLLLSLSIGHGAANQNDEPPPQPEDVSLIASQFSEDAYGDQDKLELILSGKFMLMNVHMTSDDDIFADFCDFDFQPQKGDPSLVPRFIDIHQTVHCQEHRVMLPLLDVSRASRARDQSRRSSTHSMTPNAFIFHQPKSGSALLTNMIVASQPGSRVISDSSALENILTCSECSDHAKLRALQEAVYMLGRTTSNEEETYYIKFSPQSTAAIRIVRDAFPRTKWLFVYRDVDAILQKLMDKRVERTNCDRKKRRNPGPAVTEFLSAQNKDMANLETAEQVCAAVLATDMARIREEIARPDSIGRLVDYEQDLMQTGGIQQVLDYLGIAPNWERIEEQRKKQANGGQEWKGEAELTVSQEVQSANAEFSFEQSA
jgi:hypothetical protein